MENSRKTETIKMVDARLGRDYDAVKDLLKDICLRGYRTSMYYNRIGIDKKTYNLHLRQIKSMLGEKDALYERRENGSKGKIIYFRNKPLESQNNPLAEVFRYAIPNSDDFFFTFVIVQYLYDLKKASIEDLYSFICEDFKWKDVKKKEKARKDQLRRRLEELEWNKIIRKKENRNSEGQFEYELRDIIWEKFTFEELQKLYEYISFLRNVIPFELPFVMLHENLTLWMRMKYKEKFEEMEKEIFLFRHRNPTMVLDSELIYAILYSSEQRKKLEKGESASTIRLQKDITKLEMLEKGKIEKTKKIKKKLIKWKKKRKFRDIKLCKNYGADVSDIGADCLIYDCHTGGIYGGWKDDDTSKIRLDGLRFCKSMIEGKYIKSEREMPGEVRSVFSYLNNIYLERLFELTHQKKKTWKKEELYDYFFRVDTSYKDIINTLFPTEQKGMLFRFEKSKSQYSWINPPVEPLFFIPRLALEAFFNIPQISYTEEFFVHDIALVKKIDSIIESEKLNSAWDVKDIKYNSKIEKEDSHFYKIDSLIRRYKMSGCVYDKKSEKYYYMLRMEYSIYHDAYRILGKGVTDGSLRMINIEDIEYKNCSEYSKAALIEARRNFVGEIQNYKGMMKFKLKSVVKGPSMAMDNILSRDWMNLLASYEHEINYNFPSAGAESGEFDVTLWYWKEDENEIIEELKNFDSAFKMVDTELNIL